jgi:iron complex outermembrane receptor protein
VRVVARRNLLGQALSSAVGAEQISAEEQVSLNRTVADWIERLPGVSLNGQGGLLQSYSLRGFSRWRLRTELDGVPIITDRRAGNSAEFVPPELLDSTTVQLGPASALYGSGALGGVVSLSTLGPEGPRVQASGQTGDRQRSLALAAGDPQRYAAALPGAGPGMPRTPTATG